MALYSDLLATARPGLPQVPDTAILSALRRSATRFFRQSGVWRERLDPTPARVGVNEYDFNNDNGTRIERLLSCKFNDDTTFRQIRTNELFNMPQAATGTPQYFSIESDKSTFIVWPTPDANAVGSFYFYAVIVPLRTATSLPDPLVEEWYDALVAGAKADIMRQPETPWHNPQEADRHQLVFDLGIAAAKREQVSGGWTDLSIKFQPFA